MDEEVFNMSVREFLKSLGVTAQREIELAVREQLERGDVLGDETLVATATVTIAGLPQDVHRVRGGDDGFRSRRAGCSPAARRTTPQPQGRHWRG